MIYQCQKCGLSKSDGAIGSVLPQCKCDWAAPQPRRWVGLTEEEVRKCFFRDDAPPSSPPYWWEYRNPDYRDIYALLDQALKEKNT